MNPLLPKCVLHDQHGLNALFLFFYQGFFSQTLTIYAAEGKVRGSFFISLYFFHPLTNIQTFIYNFAREMTSAYF